MIDDDLRVIWESPLDKVVAPQQIKFYFIIDIQTLKKASII